jgi:hypothetical protein
MLVRQGGRLEDEPRLRITGICQRAAVDQAPAGCLAPGDGLRPARNSRRRIPCRPCFRRLAVLLHIISRTKRRSGWPRSDP